MPVKNMLFPPGFDDPIVRGNPTDLGMSFVRCLLELIRCFFLQHVVRRCLLSSRNFKISSANCCIKLGFWITSR